MCSGRKRNVAPSRRSASEALQAWELDRMGSAPKYPVLLFRQWIQDHWERCIISRINTFNLLSLIKSYYAYNSINIASGQHHASTITVLPLLPQTLAWWPPGSPSAHHLQTPKPRRFHTFHTEISVENVERSEDVNSINFHGIMMDHDGSWWIMMDHDGSWWIMYFDLLDWGIKKKLKRNQKKIKKDQKN